MTDQPKIMCCAVGCDAPAEFEIYDSNEHRADIGPVASCEKDVGGLIGSAPPTEPSGPWMVYAINTIVERTCPWCRDPIQIKEHHPLGSRWRCPLCGGRLQWKADESGYLTLAAWYPPKPGEQPHD